MANAETPYTDTPVDADLANELAALRYAASASLHAFEDKLPDNPPDATLSPPSPSEAPSGERLSDDDLSPQVGAALTLIEEAMDFFCDQPVVADRMGLTRAWRDILENLVGNTERTREDARLGAAVRVAAQEAADMRGDLVIRPLDAQIVTPTQQCWTVATRDLSDLLRSSSSPSSRGAASAPTLPPEILAALDESHATHAFWMETKREFEREETGFDILDQAEAERDAARAALESAIASRLRARPEPVDGRLREALDAWTTMLSTPTTDERGSTAAWMRAYRDAERKLDALAASMPPRAALVDAETPEEGR